MLLSAAPCSSLCVCVCVCVCGASDAVPRWELQPRDCYLFDLHPVRRGDLQQSWGQRVHDVLPWKYVPIHRDRGADAMFPGEVQRAWRHSLQPLLARHLRCCVRDGGVHRVPHIRTVLAAGLHQQRLL
jgi:hypothetical protein